MATKWLNQRVIDPVRRVMQDGLSPQKLAASVACGVVGGIFPIPGTTALVCLPLTFATGSNPVLVQVVNLVLTPLELMLIPVFVQLGSLLFGSDASFSASGMTSALKENFWEGLLLFRTALLGAMAAWCIVAPMVFLVIVAVLTPVFRWTQSRRLRHSSGHLD